MKYLVVGLGNIGPEYEKTRHNMGFMVLDAWAQTSDTFFTPDKLGSIAQVSHRGRKITLLKPSTYMNLSGKAVRYWMQALNIDKDHLMVISDDLNLNFGTIRMRRNGSDGGHNGLKNINELLGSSDYARVRLGIGNDYQRGGQIDFVLGKLIAEEWEEMPKISEQVITGIKSFVFEGIDKAMNIVNANQKSKK